MCSHIYNWNIVAFNVYKQPIYSTSFEFLSSYRLVFIIFCYMNHWKISKNWCSVSAALTPVPWWTFMNSWKLEVRPGDWRNQCLLVGFQNLSWMPATQKTSYEIAARNNWNWEHVIFKYFPRLRGSLSIHSKIVCERTVVLHTQNLTIVIFCDSGVCCCMYGCFCALFLRKCTQKHPYNWELICSSSESDWLVEEGMVTILIDLFDIKSWNSTKIPYKFISITFVLKTKVYVNNRLAYSVQ